MIFLQKSELDFTKQGRRGTLECRMTNIKLLHLFVKVKVKI